MKNYLESFYTVRFNDCDPLRHLNNARYIDYFLNAREDHIKHHYQMDLAEFYKNGMAWVVGQHEIVYLKPASYNENICIRSGLLTGNPDYLLVEMVMLDQEQKQLKSVLHTRFVPVNIHSGRKESHTTEFMEFVVDKIVPGIESPVPSLRDRVAYWQQKIRSIQSEKV